MRRLWAAWSNFWFEPCDLFKIAIVRILVCSTLAFIYLGRIFDSEIFYSANGLLPRSMALQIIPEFFRPSFEWFFWPDSMAVGFQIGLVLGLVLLAMGIGGRVLNVILWILHIGFLQRNFSIAFGADLIGGIFLLYLSFTQSCARLSVLKMKKQIEQKPDILTNMFYRMIQIQLCIIYAYTGFEKLKGSTWWDGTALWAVFANPQMVIADFSWMKYFPLLITGLTFGTIAFEIYFPVLVWNTKIRNYVLMAGIVFHTGIGILMALPSFAIIMMAPYILFTEGKWVERLILRHKVIIK